jgi:hypothetical protein
MPSPYIVKHALQDASLLQRIPVVCCAALLLPGGNHWTSALLSIKRYCAASPQEVCCSPRLGSKLEEHAAQAVDSAALSTACCSQLYVQAPPPILAALAALFQVAVCAKGGRPQRPVMT